MYFLEVWKTFWPRIFIAANGLVLNAILNKKSWNIYSSYLTNIFIVNITQGKTVIY